MASKRLGELPRIERGPGRPWPYSCCREGSGALPLPRARPRHLNPLEGTVRTCSAALPKECARHRQLTASLKQASCTCRRLPHHSRL